MSLKSQISPKELEDLILQVRVMIEGDPKAFLLNFEYAQTPCQNAYTNAISTSPLQTLLPNTPTEISTTLASGGLTSSLAHVDPALSTLLNASRTHISSADFAIALRRCLDFGTIAMKDGLIRSGEFGEATNTSADNEAKVKLAALLPGVARWTHLALNGVPNEIIEVRRMICSLKIPYFGL